MRTTSFSVIEATDHTVTVREAAELLGRSPTWIRDRIGAGMLSRRVDGGGKIAVSMRDVTALHRARLQMNAARPPHLRLVVDNT